MTATIPKTSLQCKGNEGWDHPPHGAAQCTHQPGHWSSHKLLKPTPHSLASFNYLSWFNKPWLCPCGCSEWKTATEGKRSLQGNPRPVPFSICNCTCWTILPENEDWPLTWSKETSFCPHHLQLVSSLIFLWKKKGLVITPLLRLWRLEFHWKPSTRPSWLHL